MQYRHHFCRNAQHLVEKFLLTISTGTHRNILKLRFCTSSCSSASVHSDSTGSLRDTRLPGSAAHNIHFLLLPLTPHSSHLTVLPFAPFIASQLLRNCPQSLKQSLHFFPPLHFQLLPTLSLLSRSPSTAYLFQIILWLCTVKTVLNSKRFRAGNVLPRLKYCVSDDSMCMHTKAPPSPKLISNIDESTYMQTEETEDPFNCFSK